MKHIWLGVLVLCLMPTAALARHRDRDWDRGRSSSRFDISLGFRYSESRYYDRSGYDRYSYDRSCYRPAPRVYYYEPRVYYAPSYCAPRTYYYEERSSYSSYPRYYRYSRYCD